MTSLTLCQRNRVFRTRADAQSARPASIRVRRVRDVESMNSHLQSIEHPEPAIVLLVDAPNFEDTFRTNALAIALAFAAFQVDHRIDDAGLLFAGWRGNAQVRSSRPPQRDA